VLSRTAVVERITSHADVGAARLSREGRQHFGMLGSALPDLPVTNRAREEEKPRPGGSLFVEAEPVRYRGRLPATGHPSLARILERLLIYWQAGW
jgi:hypothetical protein